MALKDLCKQQSKKQSVERRDHTSVRADELEQFMRSNTLFATQQTLVVEDVLSSSSLVRVLVSSAKDVAENSLHTLVCYAPEDVSKNKAFQEIQNLSVEKKYDSMSEREVCCFFADFFQKRRWSQ